MMIIHGFPRTQTCLYHQNWKSKIWIWDDQYLVIKRHSKKLHWNGQKATLSSQINDHMIALDMLLHNKRSHQRSHRVINNTSTTYHHQLPLFETKGRNTHVIMAGFSDKWIQPMIRNISTRRSRHFHIGETNTKKTCKGLKKRRREQDCKNFNW